MPCGFEKAGRFPGSPAAGFCARGSFAEGRCRSRSGASWSLHQCRRARCNRREWHQVCHRYVFGGGLSRCFSRFGFTDEGHQLSRSHCSAFRPGVSVLLPAPQEVLQAAKDWILGASEDSGLAFYSAEGFLEAEEGELPGQFPLATPPSRKAKRATKPAVTPTGGGVPGERARRVTTASLAASLDQLLAVVPALSSQIQTLSEKQQLLESRVVAPSRAGALGLSQPLSASLVPAAGGAQDVAKMFATPPPRTKEPGLLGLSKAQSHQPLEPWSLQLWRRREPMRRRRRGIWRVQSLPNHRPSPPCCGKWHRAARTR